MFGWATALIDSDTMNLIVEIVILVMVIGILKKAFD